MYRTKLIQSWGQNWVFTLILEFKVVKMDKDNSFSVITILIFEICRDQTIWSLKLIKLKKKSLKLKIFDCISPFWPVNLVIEIALMSPM
jgi:hypothetical protein